MGVAKSFADLTGEERREEREICEQSQVQKLFRVQKLGLRN